MTLDRVFGPDAAVPPAAGSPKLAQPGAPSRRHISASTSVPPAPPSDRALRVLGVTAATVVTVCLVVLEAVCAAGETCVRTIRGRV